MRGSRSHAMVGVAQLVEHRVVVPGVAGSSPVTHPMAQRVGRAKGGPMSHRWMLRGALLGAALGLVGLTALAAAPSALTTSRGYAAAPAPAHSALVSVVPADQAVLDSGPTELVLTFNEDINPRFVQVALTRSGSVVPTEAATVSGRVVRSALTAPGPGGYRMAYRVVSADGHPISGETSFTVRGATAPGTIPPATAPPAGSASATASAPGGPTAGAVPAAAATAPATPGNAETTTTSASSQGRTWLYLGGALLVLAGLVAAWERHRARR